MAPKTPEEIKEGNRLRKQAQRDREKAEKTKLAKYQPAPETQEQMEARLGQHFQDLAWAQEQDAKEEFFYKGECRSCVDLLAIYSGADINAKEDDDDPDETLAEKKRRKQKQRKQVRPNPSTNKLSIRAISLFDHDIEVKIEPDQWEYETLDGDKINVRKLYEVDEVVSFRRWLDLRDKARKNLFWLCNLVGMPMYHKSHQMICDMFVQKNFYKMYFPGFNKLDISAMISRQKRVAFDGETPTRTALIFAPRSGRKSTIDGIDAVQWMLACPDVRIMIATAFRPLAKQLFAEIKSYFYLTQSGSPSPFQILFPEYVLYGRAGSSDSPIKCPAATVPSKEPHVWKTSMESSSTGMRCDIRKLDDVVDYTNSNTEELRETLVRKINATGDLVESWGFTDVVGTRYFTKDWYGSRMDVDSEGNAPEPYSYLSIPAWTPKPEFRAVYDLLLRQPNGMFQVTEEMVDLWFPQKLGFKALVKLLKEKKEISFKNQQLNIATDPKEVDNYINQFDLETLRAHTYDKSAIPQGVEIIQSWDISYSENKTSDYSVGSTLGIYKNKQGLYCVVVIEIFFEKWKSSELASNFIKYYEKHRPSVLYLENSNGVQFLMENIKNYAKLRGSDIFDKIRTRPVSSKLNAKRERIKDLEFLLGHDRLWFVSGPWIDETYKQLTEYKGGKSTAYRKDDIPDSVSIGAVSHLPSTALQHNPDPKDVEQEHEARMEKARRDNFRDRVFGSHGTRLHSQTSQPPIAVSDWVRMQRGGSPLPEPEAPTALPPRNTRADQLKKLIGKILPPGMRY
jgi:phage terminase large subunit-like protein